MNLPMNRDLEPTEITTPLGRAIEIWRSGRRISMNLAAQLMVEGFDVPSLERAHMGRR